eukprot:2905807-Rhodomonas_salina.3
MEGRGLPDLDASGTSDLYLVSQSFEHHDVADAAIWFQLRLTRCCCLLSVSGSLSKLPQCCLELHLWSHVRSTLQPGSLMPRCALPLRCDDIEACRSGAR